MKCVTITSDGVVRASNKSVASCDGYILVSQSDYQLMIKTVNIDPVEIASVFSIVFGWVVLMSYVSFKVKIGKRMVRMT